MTATTHGQSFAAARINAMREAYEKGQIRGLTYVDRTLTYLTLTHDLTQRKLEFLDEPYKETREVLEPYLGRWLHVRGTIMGFRWFPNPSGKGRILRMCIADPANIGELTYNPWCDYELGKWTNIVIPEESVPERPTAFATHVWVDVLIASVVDMNLDWSFAIGMGVEFLGKVKSYDEDTRFGFGTVIFTNTGLPVLKGYTGPDNLGQVEEWIPSGQFNTADLDYVRYDRSVTVTMKDGSVRSRPWVVNPDSHMGIAEGWREIQREGRARGDVGAQASALEALFKRLDPLTIMQETLLWNERGTEPAGVIASKIHEAQNLGLKRDHFDATVAELAERGRKMIQLENRVKTLHTSVDRKLAYAHDERESAATSIGEVVGDDTATLIFEVGDE